MSFTHTAAGDSDIGDLNFAIKTAPVNMGVTRSKAVLPTNAMNQKSQSLRNL